MLLQALTVSALAALATAAIPAGYEVAFGVGHYKLYTAAKSFGAAWKTCKDEGSNLLVVNSQRELNFIKEMYDKNHNIHYAAWMGAHDLFVEGDYVTTLGYPLSMAGYAVWHTGEPNNHGNSEHCITVYRDGTLNDDVCSRELPFFCEA